MKSLIKLQKQTFINSLCAPSHQVSFKMKLPMRDKGRFMPLATCVLVILITINECRSNNLNFFKQIGDYQYRNYKKNYYLSTGIKVRKTRQVYPLHHNF